MINDLFSHKIHASDLEEWKRKLVRLANVFATFDNKVFDREGFDRSLKLLSPGAARSPWRDIYSIYPAILGVGHIVWSPEGWKCRLSETARRYLIGSEPRVEAFCRLQLSLFQRPDARGQQYNNNRPRLEHSSQLMTLALVNEGYRICPLRLILKIFEAKSIIEQRLQDDVIVTPDEVYTLINCSDLKSDPSPSVEQVVKALEKYNQSQLQRIQEPEKRFEKRFAFLEATGLIQVDRSNTLRLYQYGDYELNQNRNRQIEAIKSIDCFFDEFNQCSDIEQICSVLASGRWADYFDACKSLPAEVIQQIAGEVIISSTFSPDQPSVFSANPRQKKRLSERRSFNSQPSTSSRRNNSQFTDPETTRILRERRNAIHHMLVQKMRSCIEKIELEPWETDLIDIGVNIHIIDKIYPHGFPISNTYLEEQSLPYFNPENLQSLTLIFEVKSSDDAILIDQVRKAVSQLYEYRYRYHSDGQIQDCAVLVIVLESSPNSQAWIKDYLLFDRHIAVCWSQGHKFDCFEECRPILEPFITC